MLDLDVIQVCMSAAGGYTRSPGRGVPYLCELDEPSRTSSRSHFRTFLLFASYFMHCCRSSSSFLEYETPGLLSCISGIVHTMEMMAARYLHIEVSCILCLRESGTTIQRVQFKIGQGKSGRCDNSLVRLKQTNNLLCHRE